jgi:hypothetical protein
LTLVLALSAFAGDIQTPSITSQQTSVPGDTQSSGATVEGEMGTPVAPDAESLAEIALATMVSTLSVF